MSAEAVVAETETAGNTANVDADAIGSAVTDDAGADENIIGAGVDDVVVDVDKGETLLNVDEPVSEEAVAPVVPETYEDFTIPENFDVSDEAIEGFNVMAKELGLSQEQAQNLLNKQSEANAANVAANEQAVVQRQKDWVDELKADVDYGGPKLGETVERANRALRDLGTPELTKLLKDSGYGNNPEVVKLFAKIDKKFGEDSMVEGTGSTVVKKSDAAILYDHPTSQT